MAGFKQQTEVKVGKVEALAIPSGDTSRHAGSHKIVTGAVQVADDLVFHKICKMLEQYNAKNITLAMDTDITGDLQIDSVAVLDLIMEVEDEYSISFPMNLLSEIRTVGDLVQAIHKQAGAQ